MKICRTIALNGIKIYAYHGVLATERQIGTYFVTDVVIDYDWSKAGETDDLNDTINYAEVYDIVKEEMAQTSQLIENVAHRISTHIMETFPMITRLKLTITKVAPPVGGEVDSSAVSIEIGK